VCARSSGPAAFLLLDHLVASIAPPRPGSPAGGVVGPLPNGRITLEEALQRYQLTEEEYRSWERAFEQYGLAGLRSAPLTRPAADWRFGVVSESAPAAGRAKQKRLARPATPAENRRSAPA
jgi:Protein of unknown function (DUF1153)